MTAEATESNEFAVRVVSSVVLAAVALAGAWAGHWLAGFVVAAAVVIVHLEWTDLTGDRRQQAIVFTGGLVVCLLLLTAGYRLYGSLLAAVLTVGGYLTTWSLWRPAGIVYATVLGFSLLFLRNAPRDGLLGLVFLFVVVWGTDIGAYAVGRLIGGRKLWPAVSPGKTWSGAIGGLLVGVAAGMAFVAWSGFATGRAILFVSLALALAAEAGDLFESWVKRRSGAKDSGRLIPGHGGLMDRVDGLVFAGGLAILIGWAHGGAGDLARGLLSW